MRGGGPSQLRMSYWNADTPNNAQYSLALIATGGSATALVIGPMVRVSTSGDGYWCRYREDTGAVQLSRVTDFVEISLSTGTGASAGDRVVLEANGPTLTCRVYVGRAGSTLRATLTATDSTYTSGLLGIATTGNFPTARGVDVWAGGNLSDDIPAFQPLQSSVVAEYYVSPSGKPWNNGSKDYPWWPTTALGVDDVIPDNSVVWWRGGTYSSWFTFYGQNVTARAYPGEWAVVDNNEGACYPNCHAALTLYGDNATYAGLLLYNSSPIFASGNADTLTGPRGYAINVHGIDTGTDGTINTRHLWIYNTGAGLYLWKANRGEHVGNTAFEFGWQGTDRGHAHCSYFENATGLVRTVENFLCWNAFSHGFRAFTTNDGALVSNLHLSNAIIFDSGFMQDPTTSNTTRNIYVEGDGSVLANNITVNKSEFYFRAEHDGQERSCVIGDLVGAQNVTFTDNQCVGGGTTTARAGRFTLFGANTYTGNTLIGAVEDPDAPRPGNTYLATRGGATGQTITYHPDRYETGRGNISVVTWSAATTAALDLSQLGLAAGDPFEIYDAQCIKLPVDSQCAEHLTGIYAGGTVSVTLPNTASPVRKPNGDLTPVELDRAENLVHGDKTFAAFIVRRGQTTRSITARLYNNLEAATQVRLQLGLSPARMDFPASTVSCVYQAVCFASVDTHFAGRMYYQWEYLAPTGTVLARSDPTPVIVN